MNLLFVTPTLPIPTAGGRARLFHLIKELANSHSISVLSFIEPSEHARLHVLKPYCEVLELVPFAGFPPRGMWRNRLAGWMHILFHRRPRYIQTFPIEQLRIPLKRLLQERVFDCAVFEQLYVAELLEEVDGLVPAVLVEQNVESDIAWRQYKQSANPAHRLRDWLSWRKLYAFEQTWVKRFPVTVAVSERDAAVLLEMVPQASVSVVPNGADTALLEPSLIPRTANLVLFFGTMNYAPNAEGILWFCQEIWPQIRSSCPSAELEIAGINVPERVQGLDGLQGVKVVGFVPEIREKLWEASIVVAPLRFGGGTRLKILEAMAAGCPVVSTGVGAEALGVVEGEHLLIADTAEEFARAVIRLLESPCLRGRLSEKGRQFVAAHYDWKGIATRMEEACNEAIKRNVKEEVPRLAGEPV